jgi:predicted transporter
MGIRLLLRVPNTKGPKDWLLLMVPCPVCASTVFFAMGVLSAYFPDWKFKGIFLSWWLFLGIGLLSYLGIFLIEQRKSAHEYSRIAGFTLLVSSLYTILLLLFSQGYAQAGNVISIRSNIQGTDSMALRSIIMGSAAVCCMAFLLGFVRRRRL